MDSGDHSAPPSFSSGGSRGVDPAYYNPPTAAVDPYATPAPSISSTGIRNPEPSFRTDGQRTVADEYHVQPPSYSGFQHTGNSINGYTGDRWLDQTGNGGQAPEYDALVHVNNSATGFNSSNGYVQAPSLSGVAPRNPSNPRGSTADPAAFDPLENVGFSIVGGNFPRQNLMGPYDY
ncbi:hypothetical protein Hanom_Chr09g00816571 [Helianthus anomalus]